MVILNLPDRVFALKVFPIRKQITISNLFSTAFSLIGDLFMVPRLLQVIGSN